MPGPRSATSRNGRRSTAQPADAQFDRRRASAPPPCLQRVLAEVPERSGAAATGRRCTSSSGAGPRAMTQPLRRQLQRRAELRRGSSRSHGDRSMRSGRVVSRRDSCSTFSMISLTRPALLLDDLGQAPVVRRRAPAIPPAAAPAWLIAPTGLRISCAMLALTAGRAPRAWTAARAPPARWCPRGTSAPAPAPRSPSGAKCGWITRAAVGAEITSPGAVPAVAGPALPPGRRAGTAGAARPRPAARPARRRGSPSICGRRLVDQADAVARRRPPGCSRAGAARCTATAREVGEVEFALLHQRLALAQPVGERDGEQRDREDDSRRAGRRREVGAGRDARQWPRSCWNSSAERDHGRGEQERVAVVRSAARWRRPAGPAACRGRWRRRRWRRSAAVIAMPSTASGNSAIHSAPGQRRWTRLRCRSAPNGEVGDADAEEQRGSALPTVRLGALKNSSSDQHHRHQQPVEVEQADRRARQVVLERARRRVPCGRSHGRGL